MAAAGPPPPASAAEAASRPASNPTTREAKTPASEELLLFEEIPVVVSSSRQAQPINWLSVPVSVVTDQDIHYSGVTNLPEILQFVPGVDYGRGNRNAYAVGIRGLHERFSDRMLTLINGHNATSPFSGGTDWLSLPVLMEDVKRIEVIRGPSGAAWGADALNGVVNIIPKEPEETLGWFASTTWDEYGDSYSHVRWGAKEGKWAWRASLGYSGQKTSDDVIRNDDFHSQDFARRSVLDVLAACQASEKIRYSFGLSYANEEAGAADTVAGNPDDPGLVRQARAFAKVDRKIDPERRFYLQWTGVYYDQKIPLFVGLRSISNELDGQYDFSLAKDHKTSVGGSLRWQNDNRVATSSVEGWMPGDPLNEYWASVFAIDRWQVTKRFALEGQLRAEYYSATQVDWAGRLTGLYSLDANGDHVVRLGAAKAYRALALPSQARMNRSFPLPSPPCPPGLFGMNEDPLLRPNNEETWAVEAGYVGRLCGPLTLRLDGYYQRYEDLIGVSGRFVPVPGAPGFSQFFAGLQTGEGATAYGSEVELAAETKAGKISVWYAYQEFRPDRGDGQDIRACHPAPHKVGITGRLFLPHDFTLNANYRYSTAAHGMAFMPMSCPENHRLDLSLAKKLGPNAELTVGVADVLNRTEPATALIATSLLHHDTPGRTFFLRFQVRF